MSGIRIIAIILIIVGILGLVYGGFTYTSKTHSTDIGPIELSFSEKESVNIPIWAGIGAIAVGGVMFFIGKKK